MISEDVGNERYIYIYKFKAVTADYNQQGPDTGYQRIIKKQSKLSAWGYACGWPCQALGMLRDARFGTLGKQELILYPLKQFRGILPNDMTQEAFLGGGAISG